MNDGLQGKQFGSALHATLSSKSLHENNRTEIVKRLLQANADVHLKGTPFGSLALTLVADNCPQDGQNRTPLELAEATPLCPPSILTLLRAAARPIGITEYDLATSKAEAKAEAKTMAAVQAEAERDISSNSRLFNLKAMQLSLRGTQQRVMASWIRFIEPLKTRTIHYVKTLNKLTYLTQSNPRGSVCDYKVNNVRSDIPGSW